MRIDPTSTVEAHLRRTALWLLDHVGPAANRQGRREAAVALRFNTVRMLRRLRPGDRRLRARRLEAIAALRTLPVPAPAPACDVAASPLPDVAGRRIAVFIPGFLSGFGGAEKVAGQVANLLARAGARVDLVCIRSGEPVRPYHLESGVEVQMLGRYGDEAQLQHRRYELMIGFGMPGFYRRIPAIATTLNVPFVIQECTNPDAMCAALARSLSLESDEEARWLRQAVLAQAAAARFTTPHYAATVHASISPFAYGFYNAFARPAGGRPIAPQRKVICVGALKNRNKNGLAAAEAFAAFAQRQPGWSLHFYGENNFAAALDGIRCASPGVEVVDEGLVKNIDHIYADAWMLVIPSRAEGLPNVVVEAFTYGVPCIGFADCPGVNHLIGHEKTGFLVRREDPQGLADAISRLADKAVRQELSANALAFATSHLGVMAWERHWVGLVSNALAGLDRTGRPARPVAGSAATWRSLLATYPVGG